jgi:hypothetical protein
MPAQCVYNIHLHLFLYIMTYKHMLIPRIPVYHAHIVHMNILTCILIHSSQNSQKLQLVCLTPCRTDIMISTEAVYLAVQQLEVTSCTNN